MPIVQSPPPTLPENACIANGATNAYNAGAGKRGGGGRPDVLTGAGGQTMLNLERLGHDIGFAYTEHVLDAQKQPQALILVSFLVTFATVRVITHAIRAGRWKRVFHNVGTPGGTHLHHLVPGILLLLISGYLGIGLAPDAHRDAFAVMFGIGAALTLDEFALWLHLQDVYWGREGRQSVDAVIIAGTISTLLILGWGFWLDLGRALGRFAGVA